MLLQNFAAAQNFNLVFSLTAITNRPFELKIQNLYEDRFTFFTNHQYVWNIVNE
jgi:hypothetical protein